jgi:hypothetical protein
MTEEQAHLLEEAEADKYETELAERRQREEERRAAERKAAQEKRDAARRKAEEQQQAARRREQEKRAAEQAKQQAELKRVQDKMAAQRQKASEQLKQALEKQRQTPPKDTGAPRQQFSHADCRLREIANGVDPEQAKANCDIKYWQSKPVDVVVAKPSTLNAPRPKEPGHVQRDAATVQPDQPIVRRRQDPQGHRSTAPSSPFRSPSTASYEEPAASRDELWPIIGVPSSQPVQPPDMRKLKHDWDALQLARAAYEDDLPLGSSVFRGRLEWKVLEKREDKASGFLAYTFVNLNEHKIVVGIQGSRYPVWLLDRHGLTPQGRDAKMDWKQDVEAIWGGKNPAQFFQAEKYVREISDRFRDRYTIDCAGHSLGGGACVYAAAQIPNVHAIAITPVSSNSLSTRNAYLIDNYITKGDATAAAHGAIERGLTGWKYEVQGTALGDVPVIRFGTRHDLDRILNALSEQGNLARYDLAQ